MDTVLLVDSSSDLPLKFIEESEVEIIGLMCHFKDKEYEDDFGKSLKYKEFYDGMRNGEKPYTSQINSYRFEQKFKELVKKNKKVIYLAFDSAISGTFGSAEVAKEEVIKEYPDADIKIVDTKCASIGEGILVYCAWKMLEAGKSGDEVVEWAKNSCLKVNHWFIVENLFHLSRGGRLSMPKAVVGTLLNIKPIICINDLGQLINIVNIRGKKKAIRFLAEELKEKGSDYENMIVGISHGDCIEEAEYLAEIVENEFHVKKILINHVGPVIGSHVGPGMLSLCFFSEKGRI